MFLTFPSAAAIISRFISAFSGSGTSRFSTIPFILVYLVLLV